MTVKLLSIDLGGHKEILARRQIRKYGICEWESTVYMHTSICMYVCMYVYMYACMYLHIDMQSGRAWFVISRNLRLVERGGHLSHLLWKKSFAGFPATDLFPPITAHEKKTPVTSRWWPTLQAAACSLGHIIGRRRTIAGKDDGKYRALSFISPLLLTPALYSVIL